MYFSIELKHAAHAEIVRLNNEDKDYILWSAENHCFRKEKSKYLNRIKKFPTAFTSGSMVKRNADFFIQTKSTECFIHKRNLLWTNKIKNRDNLTL